MKRVVLCAGALLSCLAVVGSRCHAQPAGVVYLDQGRNWRIDGGAGGLPVVRFLLRELVRQAILIAARDEMGLATRDAWLGDTMPTEGDNAPCDIVAPLQYPLVVDIVRGFPPNQAKMARQEVRAPQRLNCGNLLGGAEALSRKEFVECLKQLGFEGRPRVRNEALAVPGEVEALLGEMSFVSQFHALRELHAMIGSQGESSALVGALVRGYAHLGVLTEHHWHPAHKVFKARALLYAQRLVARDEQSPVALWHRAYAFAFAGLHASAESDMKRADEAWEALPEQDRPRRPAWTLLIAPLYCYDVEELARHVDDPQVGQLAAMLKFLAADLADFNSYYPLSRHFLVRETWRRIPEFYRIHRELRFREQGFFPWAHAQPVRVVGQRLYGRLEAVPGVPEDVRRIARQWTSRDRGLWDWFGVDLFDQGDEFGVRRRLTDALREAGGPAASDRGEPSWALLGQLIGEISFLQALEHGGYWLRINRADLRPIPSHCAEVWKKVAPLVEGHPFAPYVEIDLVRDIEVGKDLAQRLAKVDPTGSGGSGLRMWRFLWPYRHQAEAVNFYQEHYRNFDDTAFDNVETARLLAPLGQFEPLVPMIRGLLRVSPRSPYARGILVQFDWEGVRARAAQWERESGQHPEVCCRLGERYVMLDRLEDAERCFQSALKAAPDHAAALWHLARIGDLRDLAQGKPASTPRKSDPPEDSRLGRLVDHFLARKDWRKVSVYAQWYFNARQRGLCLGQCSEGLQQWDDANEHYKFASDEQFRMPNAGTEWYFFCRRTGEGDLDEARKTAEKAIKFTAPSNYPTPLADVITFELLEGRPEKARPLAEQLLATSQSPRDALWLALIADQLHDAKARDAALERAKILGARIDSQNKAAGGEKAKSADGKAPVPNGAGAMAELIAKDLAAGGNGDVDLEAANRLGGRLPGEEQVSFHYLLGQYLNLHGRPEAADDCWKRCMGWPKLIDRFRTLAGAALTAHSIWPADYKDLLRGDGEDAKKVSQGD